MFGQSWLKTASDDICERDKKLFMSFWIICSGLCFICSALLPVTDTLLYQPCVNQGGELRRFSPHIKSGTQIYEYANVGVKPHREHSRWNMSSHVNWWHYWAHRGCEWPSLSSTDTIRLRPSGQEAEPEAEIILIRSSQPTNQPTSFHPSESGCQFI